MIKYFNHYFYNENGEEIEAELEVFGEVKTYPLTSEKTIEFKILSINGNDFSLLSEKEQMEIERKVEQKILNAEWE